MKKQLVVLTAVVAASTMIMTGCGKKDIVNPDDHVTLPEYKGIEVEVDAINVTEEEINSYIEAALENAAVTEEVTDRAVEEGDTVNIDYVGKKDGVAFEGGTSPEGGYDLLIGSGNFIDGFEDGLIGAKKGETVELDLTFPENYDNELLAGQAVVFTVTVNKITTSVVPELTDEVVPTLAEECKTVDEYKQYVADLLLEQETETYHNTIGGTVFQKVFEEATVENIPQDMVDKYTEMQKAMAESFAAIYQTDLETYVTQGLQSTMEDFEKQVEAMANDMAKENLIIRAISKAEGISVTEQEIKDFAEESYAQSGAESADAYIEQVGKDEIETFLLSEKVMEALEGFAQVTEK